MSWLSSLVLVVHILVAIGIIGLVLMQHGKGADMGATFGGGASGSLFGATGSANFLSRTTAVLATIFFATSAILAYTAANQPKSSGSVMQETLESSVPVQAPVSEPVATGEGSKSVAIPK